MFRPIDVPCRCLIGIFLFSTIARAAVDQPADEARVISALKKLGAKVETGDDRRIVAVDLTRTSATAATIEMLQPCTQLRRLTATGIPVTDDSLSTLAGLSNLANLRKA